MRVLAELGLYGLVVVFFTTLFGSFSFALGLIGVRYRADEFAWLVVVVGVLASVGVGLTLDLISALRRKKGRT